MHQTSSTSHHTLCTRIGAVKCIGVHRFNATNLRVFGSVLEGSDREGSDLDLIADPLPGATLLDPQIRHRPIDCAPLTLAARWPCKGPRCAPPE